MTIATHTETAPILAATSAQQIAEILGNDGQNLYADTNGKRTHVRDLCRQSRGIQTSGGTEVERFDFEDGSALVVIVAGCWDYPQYARAEVASFDSAQLEKAARNSELTDLLADLENEDDDRTGIEAEIREALLFAMAG